MLLNPTRCLSDVVIISLQLYGFIAYPEMTRLFRVPMLVWYDLSCSSIFAVRPHVLSRNFITSSIVLLFSGCCWDSLPCISGGRVAASFALSRFDGSLLCSCTHSKYIAKEDSPLYSLTIRLGALVSFNRAYVISS